MHPNMSYCMCENTLLAVNQILSAIAEEDANFWDNLSQSEKDSFKALVEATKDLQDAVEDLGIDTIETI
jgi:hypothetical protein